MSSIVVAPISVVPIDVEWVSDQPIVAVTPNNQPALNMAVVAGIPGPPGIPITVSTSQPQNPNLNDLWIDIS